MLSLVVYAIGSYLRHILRRENMFYRPRFLKGVWRYLYQDGHEHISLMPFFIV